MATMYQLLISAYVYHILKPSYHAKYNCHCTSLFSVVDTQVCSKLTDYISSSMKVLKYELWIYIYIFNWLCSADGKRGRVPGQRLRSNRTARCLTNVEAFTLRARDLEEVTSLFPRILRNPRIQGAIRSVNISTSYINEYAMGNVAFKCSIKCSLPHYFCPNFINVKKCWISMKFRIMKSISPYQESHFLIYVSEV